MEEQQLQEISYYWILALIVLGVLQAGTPSVALTRRDPEREQGTRSGIRQQRQHHCQLPSYSIKDRNLLTLFNVSQLEL